MNKYVSRAGEKLEHALKKFKISVEGKICADFGSSTGGFVDCLLRNGAKKVYSVDTSYGELAWKLRNDPRVEVMERTNALHVKIPPPTRKASDGQGELVDLITVDVGWTKQEKIIPNALKNLKPDGKIISLVKPHYEAEKKYLRKGKLQEDQVEQVLQVVQEKIEKAGGKIEKVTKSPIVGRKGGNVEYLFLISPIKSSKIP